MSNYGKELILDLHNCDTNVMNRRDLRVFFEELCEEINMEPCKVTFWDDKYTLPWMRETEDHLVGTSAVQFIKTSNITIHTLTKMERVYLNIFSCKDFNQSRARAFCQNFFNGVVVNSKVITRF